MDVIIPNCEVVSDLVAQVNKKPVVFFVKSVFSKKDVSEDWAMHLVRKVFSGVYVLNTHKYEGDKETRTVTLPNNDQEKFDVALWNEA